MGVYIKSMEMPTSCHDCVAGYGGCCFVAPAESSGICPDQGRADFCPLVPVPPHGDLIGREWLVDIALHLMNTAKNDDIANGVKWLLQYIIESPTIIPAEGDTDFFTAGHLHLGYAEEARHET